MPDAPLLGWFGEYFRGDAVAVARVDPALGRGFAEGLAEHYTLGSPWKGRWKTLLTVDTPGLYGFGVFCNGGGFVLKIGTKIILNDWVPVAPLSPHASQSVLLAKGVYPVRLSAYFPHGDDPETLEFWWRPPGDTWNRVTTSRLTPDFSAV